MQISNLIFIVRKYIFNDPSVSTRTLVAKLDVNDIAMLRIIYLDFRYT